MPGLSALQLFERGKNQLAENRRQYARILFRKSLKEGKLTLEASVRADVLVCLAKVDRDLGLLEQARVHYAMAAEVIRTLDRPLALAHTLRHAADILREQKKAKDADRMYEEVLAIYRAHPESRALDLANALRGYALLKGLIGDTVTSAQMWREAGDLYASVEVDAGVAESKEQIARLTE